MWVALARQDQQRRRHPEHAPCAPDRKPSPPMPSPTQAAIMACAPALLPKFTAAGISLGSLMRLQNCKALPPCLAQFDS